MPPKLVQAKSGYFTFAEKPDEDELNRYYAEKYYQDADEYGKSRSYSTLYPIEEIEHKNYISFLMAYKALQLAPQAKIAFDLGCGEGFLIKSFFKNNLTCYGMDFSNFAISKFNPEYLDYFEQGDILNFKLSKVDPMNVDIVSCMNVLEHVRSPEIIFERFRNDFKQDTLFMVQVPNDFSDLQKHLIKNKLIDREFWVSYPEHLSYFNKESFTKFAESYGFHICNVMADYPIDLLLLNDELNYVHDSSKGKLAHKSRVATNLFLSKQNTEDVIKLYEAYAQLGLGRNLTYFMKQA